MPKCILRNYLAISTNYNCAGVDENPIATDEIELRLKQGHLRAFDTAAELNDFVGATDEYPAILSKIGIITRCEPESQESNDS
jgi:hypothetical protein